MGRNQFQPIDSQDGSGFNGETSKYSENDIQATIYILELPFIMRETVSY